MKIAIGTLVLILSTGEMVELQINHHNEAAYHLSIQAPRQNSIGQHVLEDVSQVDNSFINQMGILSGQSNLAPLKFVSVFQNILVKV